MVDLIDVSNSLWKIGGDGELITETHCTEVQNMASKPGKVLENLSKLVEN